MFYLKATCSEGTFYLVNGWNKYWAFWTKTKRDYINGFKTIGSLKTSYTKLLKISDVHGFDYDKDSVEIIEE